MIRTTPPSTEGRATGRLVMLVAILALGAAGLAGCGVLSAYTGLPLGGGYNGFSDGPDPCDSAAAPEAQYRTGSATVTFSNGTAPLEMTLEDGQYVPADASSTTLDCFGSGTEVVYRDSSSVWMLSIEQLNDGTRPNAAPSAAGGPATGGDTGQATVSLDRDDTTSNGQAVHGQAVQSDNCHAALTSTGPKAFSGVVTCPGVTWWNLGPGGSSSTSSSPFDLTVTFTATP